MWSGESGISSVLCGRVCAAEVLAEGRNFFRELGKRGVGVVVVFRSSYDPASLAHLLSGVEEKEG